MKITVITLLLLGCFTTTSSQVVQDNRMEFPLTEPDIPYDVTIAGETGLFLHRNLYDTRNNLLELTRIDSSLQILWRGFISLTPQLTVSKSCFLDSSLYLIMRHSDYNKNDLLILDVNAKDGSYTSYQFQNFIPLYITRFHVTRQGAIIGGYFNHIPVVLFYSFGNAKSKVVPGLFTEPGELIQIRTYADDSFDVIVSAKNFTRQQTIAIRNYDAGGNLTSKTLLEPEPNKDLLFGQSIKTNQQQQLVAGVYGHRNSEYSKGIFVAALDDTGHQKINYYGYSDLENFFKFMKANREQRVKDRVERKKIKGKKIHLNYRFLVHELLPYHNNQYLLVGEVFYPHYLYTDRLYGTALSYNYRANARFQDGRIFDGYTYTHAVVIGFSTDGRLIWDNSFEINDVRSFELEQFVKVDSYENHLALLYLYNHQIRTKIIQGNAVLEGKSMESIKLTSGNDVVKKNDTEKSKLAYGYGHYFYAYGIQRISSPSLSRSEVKRRVFFINKIHLDEHP